MSSQANDSKISTRWRSIKAQFRRIIWPSRETIARESAVVLCVSIVLGLVIAVLDRVLLQLIDLIIAL
jgi:preprotein translocase subunit SecE